MNTLFKDLTLLYVCLNVFAYLFWQFNIFGGSIVYPFGSAADLTNISSWFSINLFSGLVGAGAIGIGLAALLLKANTYAVYAMVIFGVGIMFNIVQKFLLAIPNTLGALIPEAINPTPGSINPISIAIGVIVAYAVFWALFNTIFQREP